MLEETRETLNSRFKGMSSDLYFSFSLVETHNTRRVVMGVVSYNIIHKRFKGEKRVLYMKDIMGKLK